jgi:hypothetical protein
VRYTPLLFLLFTSCAHAAIYRCEHAGTVAFQERPCAEGPSPEVTVQDYRIGTVPPPQTQPANTRQTAPTRHKPDSRPRHPARTATDNQKVCLGKRQQLEKIRWQLSRGYKASAGERLHFRQRQLEDYLRAQCPD